MATDWEGLAVIVGLALFVVWVARWIGRTADRNMQLLERRFVDPQDEAAGTGVERPVRSALAGPAASLPRSPLAPAGTADPRPGVPAGLHHRIRVIFHG